MLIVEALKEHFKEQLHTDVQCYQFREHDVIICHINRTKVKLTIYDNLVMLGQPFSKTCNYPPTLGAYDLNNQADLDLLVDKLKIVTSQIRSGVRITTKIERDIQEYFVERSKCCHS